MSIPHTPEYPEVIADDTVVLRPWREDDVDAQLAAWSDPMFRRFSDWAPSNALEAIERIQAQHSMRAEGHGVAFAVCDSSPSEVVLGEVSINSIDPTNRSASIGYWLAPEARGRGVVTRAVRLATRFAFDRLELNRIELTCGPDNAASAAVATRAGFTFEGKLRSNLLFKGAFRDSLVFSLLKDDDSHLALQEARHHTDHRFPKLR